jgi:N6-adenosine-specific RNA methylase IME4
MKKYQVIYADPPWDYRVWDHEKCGHKYASHYYPVMTVEQICLLPIQNIADDNCCLFLWTTPPCLQEAMRVVKSWGFAYKTKAFCWVKMNKSGMGIFTGMGYWTRSNSEDCWLCTKGHPKRIDASVNQIILSPLQNHSQKPAIARELIIKLLGDLPRIELFARQRVPGWDCWGNEVESDIDL